MNGNNNGAVIGLIVAITLLLITAFIAYSNVTKASNFEQQIVEQTSNASEIKTVNNNLVADASAVKSKLGYEGELGGAKTGTDTVLAKLEADLERFGGSAKKPTVAGTLESLRTELNTKVSEARALDEANKQLQQRINELESQYASRVATFEEATNDAKNDLNNVTVSTNDMLAKKDDEIAQKESVAEEATAAMERLRRQMGDQIDELAVENDNFNKRIELLGQELAEKNKVSFDRADGKVVRADPRQQLVYIDLGERDGLTTRTTFSVYKRNNAGIGRGLEDVKGAIEVIRVLSDRQSEARVLEEDKFDPIGAGDLLYSPLWQAGQTNYFSFVGLIDLDNDGQDDRDLLFQMLEDQGSKVELYVDEKGQRRNAAGEVDPDIQLTSKTKYLVIGEIPDRSDYAPKQDEYEWAVEIADRRAELEKEANQQGILKVNLPDFQSQIGYKPSQKLFIPGNRRSAENLGR